MTNQLLATVPPEAYPLVINAIASQVVNTPLANQLTSDVFHQKGKNYALFTHNIFKITDQLSLTLGARYTIDRKELSADLFSNSRCAAYLNNIVKLKTLAATAAANPALFGPLTPAIVGLSNALATSVLTPLAAPPCAINSITGVFDGGKKRENKFTGTAVLSYKPMDNLLTYISYSRGYKAGGFNLDRAGLTFGAVNLNDLRFAPEIVDNYEIGAKYNGRGFDVNVALFNEEFKNFQLNTFNGTIFVVENINSCSDSLGGVDQNGTPGRPTVACSGHKKPGLRSRGIEVETFFRPLRDVNGALGVTYADTRFRHNLISANGNAIPPVLYQLPGRRLSLAPKFVATASLGWTPAIGSGGMHALFYVDGRYSSSYNTGSDLDIEKTQKGFGVVNGRVGIRGPNENWALELWAQNVFNKTYKQIAFDSPLQGSCSQRGANAGFCSATPGPGQFVSTQLFSAFLADPRTVGVTARVKWNAPPRAVAYEPAPAPPPPEPVVEQPAPPPPPPPPPAPVERGERGQ